MTKLEDRLRQDLPALADVIMEEQTAQPFETAGGIAGGPGLVVELSPQPARTKRRWPVVALAAATVAVIVGVAALMADTSDDTEVTTVESPTVESPAVESPTVESPTVESPAVESPTVESPTVESPAVESPTVESPTVDPVAPLPAAGSEAEGLAPEELSTAPVLRWTEIDPPFDGGYGLESVGDGRILARVPGEDGRRVLVTDNGVDWTELPLPEGIDPAHVDISGERWVVTEYDLDADAGDSRASTKRVVFSDDRASTWNELLVEVPVAAGPAAPYVMERSAVMAALASGERILIVVAGRTEFDMVALLLDQGLISTEESFSVLRWGDGAVTIEPISPDDLEYEGIAVSYETLGLTDDQLAVLEHPLGDGRIWIFISDGSIVELAAEYDGWGAVGAATADRFALLIEGPQDRFITSDDGRAWREIPMDPSFVYPPARIGVDDEGGFWVSPWVARAASYVKTLRPGEDPATEAILRGIHLDAGVVAGPAGLAATARTSFLDATAMGSFDPDATPDRDAVEESLGPEATWVGWSPDGTEWEWQTMADAFGSRGGWALAELAVGRDFVLARVMGSDLPPEITEVVRPQVGSLTRGQATDTHPERWFIASVP